MKIRAFVLLFAVAASFAAAAPVPRAANDAGTIFRGPANANDWGRPLASGDLDGDGYDEIIVGDSESWGGVTSRVYVMRGGPGRHGLGIVNFASAAPDQLILGATLDDNLGCSIATGDVNGDGVADLLMCASSASYPGLEACGVAYVIFGGPNFFDLATRDLATEANWDLRLIGPVAGGDMGGYNMFGGLDAQAAAVGRLNDDEYGDIILGVHLADGGATQAGRVYAVFGGPFPSGYTLNLSTYYNVRVNGKGQYDELGTVVLAADLTGDGLDELIIPCEYASRGLFTSEGAAYIFRGRATWPSTINLTTTPADITLLGWREDDNLGTSAAVGDFNADGIADLAVAAPGADAGAYNDQRGDGFVYGLLGSTTYQTGTHTFNYTTAIPDFLLIGDFEENLGDTLAAGDFNADGYDDLAAGERFGGPDTNGVVEVLYGRDFVAGDRFTANVNTDVRITGNSQDRIGFSLSSADVNADGRTEIVFGTPFNNNNRGTVYAFTQIAGDPDADRDLDLRDFATFQQCFAATTPLAPACSEFDFDFDEALTAADFETIEIKWTGPIAGE